MDLFPMQNPTALLVAVVIVGGQVAAFLWAIAIASRFPQMFDVDGITITAVPNPSTESPPANTVRFEWDHTEATERLAAELRSLAAAAIHHASDATAQITLFRDTVLDFVERYEERLATFANVPVYLGLLGTFAGIMIGVAQIVSRGLSEDSVRGLLAGVLIAMASSFIGVLMMIAANAVVIPRARRARDVGMASYFATIERRMFSAIAAQAHGHRANDIDGALALERQFAYLSESLDRFSSNIEPQRRLLQTVQELDLPNLARANAELTARLSEAARQLQGAHTRLAHSIAEHAEALSTTQLSDVDSRTIARGIGALPDILTAVQRVLAEVSKSTKSSTDLLTSARLAPEQRHTDSGPSESTRPVEWQVVLAAGPIFALSLVSFQAGLYQFNGSHLGAGLMFGGAVLAYEAAYVVFRRVRSDGND